MFLFLFFFNRLLVQETYGETVSLLGPSSLVGSPAFSLMCCVVVQSLCHVRLFATPWTAARQASLSITNPRSLLKVMSIESVMPSKHLILCRPLLPPSLFPSIRVFSRLSSRWGQKLTFLQVSAHLGEKISSKVLSPVSTPDIPEPLNLKSFKCRC